MRKSKEENRVNVNSCDQSSKNQGVNTSFDNEDLCAFRISGSF